MIQEMGIRETREKSEGVGKRAQIEVMKEH